MENKTSAMIIIPSICVCTWLKWSHRSCPLSYSGLDRSMIKSMTVWCWRGDELHGCSKVKIEMKMRGKTVKYLLRVINIVIVRGRLVPLRITCHQILGYSSACDQVRRKQGCLCIYDIVLTDTRLGMNYNDFTVLKVIWSFGYLRFMDC